MTLGPLHTLVYPAVPGALRQGLAVPPKTPSSIRHYIFDFGPFALDAGTTVASAFLLADPSLTVAGATTQGNQVLFTVAGGNSSIPLPVISFAILLADGQREDVTVVQPIDALAPPIPAGAIAVGSQPLTLDHIPLDVSQMLPVPGGVQAGDAVLLYRAGSPSAVYLLDAASLGGGGAGGGGTYAFAQSSPAATWTITHNLGRYPSVSIVTSSGDQVMGNVHYAGANQVVLTFAAAFAGTAYLN